MPSALPDGDPAPPTARCRRRARRARQRPFGVYVHVPFCTVRCGYCDFNTYTADELGRRAGASRATYADAAIAEVELARRVLGRRAPAGRRRSSSAAARRRCCRRPTWPRSSPRSATSSGWRRGAEVTTEANPDSVDAGDLAALRDGGFTRISFGMQSAVPHVLRGARPHPRPGAGAARSSAGRAQAGLRAGQPRPDLRHAGGVARRLAGLARRGARLRARPRLGVRADRRGRHRARPAGPSRRGADARRRRPRRQVPARRRAASPPPASAGTRCPTGRATEAGRCRHNLRYWTGGDWWGVGPGAHCHVGGVRWWNVKHPAAYAERLAAGVSPGARPRGARTTRPGGSSGCCSSSGCARACRVDVLDDAGRADGRPAGRRGLPSAVRRPAGAHPPRPAARRRRGARPARLSRWS